MSAYAHDRRVRPHPDDGTWIVYDDQWAEFNVAPLRHPDTGVIIPDLFGAFDTRNRRVADVAEGPFDDVVYSLIGDPR